MTTQAGRWLRDLALPLWIDEGWDGAAGSFVEAMSLDGEALLDLPRRTLVQCRQITVMCVAERRKWCAGAGVRAVVAAQTLMTRFCSPDGKDGFVFALGRGHDIVDDRRDLYTHAFVLLAFAELHKLTGEIVYLDQADHVLRFLDARMSTPETGGFAESEPRRAEARRQNPHMHLFEALLALHEADRSRGYLARAADLRTLLRRRFVGGRAPLLIEFYDDDWSPQGGPDFPFEPGHHFEWAWLLDRFAILSASPRDPLAESLWTTAVSHGVSDSLSVADCVCMEAGPISGSTRLWPHAEAAKAATCGFDGRISDAGATGFLDVVARRFLVENRGLWIDRFDAAGVPLSTSVPASSLYHLCGAIDAVENRFVTSAPCAPFAREMANESNAGE